MRARDAIDAARHRGEAVGVCALGMAANEWWAATKSEDSFTCTAPWALPRASRWACPLAAARTGVADQCRRIALHEPRMPR
jgi:hypothetical protein